MSLIADALKAAERERRDDAALVPPRRLVAQTGFFGTPQAPGSRFAFAPWFRLGVGIAATAAVGLGALYVSRRPAASDAEGAPGGDVRSPLPAGAGGGRAVTDSLAFARGQSAAAGGRSQGGTDAIAAAPAPVSTALSDAHSVDRAAMEMAAAPAAAPAPATVTQQGAAAGAVLPEPGAQPPAESAGVATDPSPVSALAAPPAPERPASGGLRIALDGGAPSSGRATARAALDAQRRGDFALARDLYRRLIAAGAASAAIHNNLGAVLRQTGDLTGAIASYREAIEKDPSLVEGWLNLGTALAEQSQADAATAAFQRALALDPGNATARVRLAQQYRALGAQAEARRLLEEAVGLAPDQPDAHYLLGQVLEELGDRRGAAREFLEFLRVGRGFAPAFVEQVRRHATWLESTR
ncbi:MAG: tetratricopeptide repeat protein [Gemmatimonadaceae bacterium]